MEKEFLKLTQYLDSATNIGLITHKDGDGDAFGSMLSFGRFLIDSGKKVTYFSNEAVPDIFKSIASKIDFHPTAEHEPVDLLIGFDANALDRFTLPEVAKKIKSTHPVLCLDHHQPLDSEKEFELYINDKKASCTAELVYDFFKFVNYDYDKLTANLLLLGIETDTFSLQFTNTTPKTFMTVAELLKKGARLKSIVESALGGRPIPTLKLLGRAIDRLDFDHKKGIATTYVLLSDIAELSLKEQASSGVANFLDQLNGAKVVAVLEEKPRGLVKVSLRSNNSNYDVNELAKSFGGGGHKKAAGFESLGSVFTVREKIIEAYLKNK